MERTRN